MPSFEKALLRGAANSAIRDNGTPVDAATRFFVAYAETHVLRGGKLNDIDFGKVLGRMLVLKPQLSFWDEHKSAMKKISEMESGN